MPLRIRSVSLAEAVRRLASSHDHTPPIIWTSHAPFPYHHPHIRVCLLPLTSRLRFHVLLPCHMADGGYACLAGMAFTPDLYACGVDIVGPSNIKTLLCVRRPPDTRLWVTATHNPSATSELASLAALLPRLAALAALAACLSCEIEVPAGSNPTPLPCTETPLNAGVSQTDPL